VSTVDDWTPEQRERLLAAIFVRDPRWTKPVIWLVLTIPGCVSLADRLHNWRMDRAVRLYREGRR
jgi:hypothetical protein